MIIWIRRIRRKYSELTRLKKALLLGATVFILWICGLLDKAREEDFAEFEWPRLANQESTDSHFMQFPICRLDSDALKLMILIKSSSKNRQMRESVRRTWGSYRVVDEVQVMSVFILFAALDYAGNPSGCVLPDFSFLVDDDYMVHIPNLIKFLKTKSKNDLVYEGFVFDSSPFRLKLHKHSISLDEYPYSRYPPYVSAGAVFLTSATVERFKNTMRQLKMFPFDDVFTGILAKSVGVLTTHNENFIFWNRHVTRAEWDDGVIAVHEYARKNLEDKYNQLFG
ncbi:Protein CBR-BRE-5 [Caenorhabditis briggsae]|uniref:Hexosyltransferase n=1 Tax=Caenorhabditis briggsae TaxID=6238 RepID=A8X0M5_CAEBR|nr:Protein CBR-BRE-5 [Caenorhabditis briggsae]CAP26185.2 Protein CBR-BRE-5 [Caenorhabditis briggsae]